ncbi:MAG TPA: hypothetical protein VH120_01185, partial [Gemmataceae bacterium]|nr:hypothetical protein [Gemmataceae bacterium]
TIQVDVILDTGAECCLFAEWVGRLVGLKQLPASPVITIGSSVSRTGVSAWFQRVELQLDPVGGVGTPFRWTGVVGFTPIQTFTAGRASGILGVNGGLDQFQRVEFDWSAAAGPEVVIRT